jgi:hypothetical protein
MGRARGVNKSAARQGAAKKGSAKKGVAKKATKGTSQRRQLTRPNTQTDEERVETMEAVFEERGMPEGQAAGRARNAANRIESSKQMGKRLDAKPTKPGGKTNRARPSSAKTVSATKAAEEERKRLEKPMDSGHGNYSPASPHRRKRGGEKSK